MKKLRKLGRALRDAGITVVIVTALVTLMALIVMGLSSVVQYGGPVGVLTVLLGGLTAGYYWTDNG